VQLTLLEAWSGALAYTLQLYFDFSGYSDMAIGLARLFGIRLPINFHSPYKAVNIIDFWRRWHITLSRFLRDYLYFPLGGNRKGKPRRYLNLFVTMLLGGLWHGGGWTFVFWGGLHGLYLVINHAWQALRHRLGGDPARRGTPAVRFLARFLTFVAVVVAWVFFRAENFDAALVVLRGMSGLSGVLLPSGYQSVLGILTPLGITFGKSTYSGAWPLLVVLLLVVWLAPNSMEILRRYRPALTYFPGTVLMVARTPLTWRANRKWMVLTAVLLVVSILNMAEVSEFLYFQF